MNEKKEEEKRLKMEPKLIAHCGINCAVCYRFIQKANSCPGCLIGIGKKLPHPKCEIRACAIHHVIVHCYECPEFPCEKIVHLNTIYTKQYGLSLILNNYSMKNGGISRFLASERIKWECPNCHGRLSVHLPDCPYCHEKNPNMMPGNE
jgi:hypothetical protein